MLGCFVAGPGTLADFASDTIANSDNRPVVASLASRAMLAPEATPREHLYALLAQWRLVPQEIVAGASEDDARRLAAYWQARDRYLLAGRQIPSRPPTCARCWARCAGRCSRCCR